MTVNQKIIEALQPFGLPIVADFFGGGNEEYFTFDYTKDAALIHADDSAVAVEAAIALHYFLPADKDYLKMKKKVRKALERAGFTYPEVDVVLEPGNKIRHIIFECEIENEDEMEE